MLGKDTWTQVSKGSDLHRQISLKFKGGEGGGGGIERL